MFASRVAARFTQTAGRRFGHTSSHVPNWIMDNVWRKKTSLYAAWMFAGAAVLEYTFGGLADWLWVCNNNGKLYEHINWSDFKPIDSEDDE